MLITGKIGIIIGGYYDNYTLACSDKYITMQSLRFSIITEANASVIIENLEDMFIMILSTLTMWIMNKPLYGIHEL